MKLLLPRVWISIALARIAGGARHRRGSSRPAGQEHRLRQVH